MRMICKECECTLWSQPSREAEICPDCVPPDNNETLTLEDRLAIATAVEFHNKGVSPRFSMGICEELTVGYGKIDEYGYWEFPLPSEYWPEWTKKDAYSRLV
jgi:hypothetical protein